MTSKKASISFIFATIFLDALGIGILIPILPDLIRRFSSDPTFVSHYFGYFISVYALMQFLASPILGALSDRFGRRPILLVSLGGAVLDYILMAYAPNLTILFIGRVIAGLTGASMTVATAYIADISDDNTRSANFGMIGAAFGLGFIIGPAIGGGVGTFGHEYPFLAAAGLNLLNFVFGLFILPESLPKELRRKVDFTKLNPFKSLVKIFTPSTNLALLWVYMLFVLAGQVHPSSWALLTEFKFKWTPADIGISLSVVGITAAVVQGGLTRVLIPKMGEWKALIWSILIGVIAFAGYAFANAGWVLYAILIPSSIAGIGGPALQSLISRETPSQEQGELQGVLVSLASLTAIVGPLIYTELFARMTKPEVVPPFPGAPYLLASLISIFCGIIIFIHYRGIKHENNSN
ncbi:TCR/Tet family MFS transporter [Bdellovibrio sp. HCB337]|uniref:TCR/Tet family MFS transporter n=1 Tax=Bdellovibrio sp. HCB337 TaxID=3394358 RepID=UPI0039A6727C